MTYSIKPILRMDKAPKPNGKYPLYYLIRLDRTLIKIPTGKEIEPKFWDRASGKVKGGGMKQLFNSALEKKVSEFNEFILKSETLGKEVNRSMAKEFFRKRITRKTIFQFWEDQIMLWKNIKKESTLNSYRYTLQILKQFNPDAGYDDLTFDFIERFDHFLRCKRNNTDGGVFGRHKCLKAMIKVAIKKGFMTKNPYEDFKIKPALGKRMFLEVEEVRRLMTNSKISHDVSLLNIRDMFLFGCFTGLRFSDIIALQWSNVNLENKVLHLTMEKTAKPIAIPLISPALEVLNKKKLDQNKLSALVFDQLTNQYVNRELKKLMTACAISKKITFHCARHTFASNHIEANTHMLVLKDLLGHSHIAQTEIYSKTLKSGLVTAMNELERAYQYAAV